jgi:hypothetical protein
VQIGVDALKILQNVRVLNLPTNNKNRSEILDYLKEYFSKFENILIFKTKKIKMKKGLFGKLQACTLAYN